MISSAVRIATLAALLISLYTSHVRASSAPPRPLKRIAYPTTHALEILPRQPSLDPLHQRSLEDMESTTLRHSDSLRLTISAFSEDYHLHLRPNDELIHPAARINYYRPLTPGGPSVLHRTEPLLRDSIFAYWGEVFPVNVSDDRLREDAVRAMPRQGGRGELGWARIVVLDQGDADSGIPPIFEGAFTIDGVVHHIVTKDNYMRTKHPRDPDLSSLSWEGSPLIIYRDSDLMEDDEEELVTGERPQSGGSCSHDSLAYNRDPSLNSLLRVQPKESWSSRYLGTGLEAFTKRDDVAGGNMTTNFINTIGQTQGCTKTPQILFMGVAADCEYVQIYGSAQNATAAIIRNFNSASTLYKTSFNISLGITELQVQDGACPATTDPANPWNVPCNSTLTLNDRLSIFSDWRGQKGDDGAGLWHLMSGCPTGTEVGVAWLGTICQVSATGQGDNIVSGTAVSTSGRTEWQVVAHEVGHNFGAIHDCTAGCTTTSSCCPLTADTCDANSGFLMSPVAASNEQKFSQCSIGNICSVMGNMNAACLKAPDPSQKIISLQMCGNGIVETGEDCDPGQGQVSPCCDSTTCKFTNAAKCDPASSPCCLSTCQFSPATQVCRPARNAQCDSVEMCTGTSADCPADVTMANGLNCGDGLACAGGTCTSPSKQCQAIGQSMNLKEACPNKNDNRCQVSCQDPDVANQCIVLQAQLVDGSPCGFGGTCTQGICQAGSLLDTAKAWYTSNLQISIPVTVVAAIVALLFVYGGLVCMKRYCCGARLKQKKKAGILTVNPADSFKPQHEPKTSQSSAEDLVTRPRPAASASHSRSIVPETAWDYIPAAPQGLLAKAQSYVDYYVPSVLRPGASSGANSRPRSQAPRNRNGPLPPAPAGAPWRMLRNNPDGSWQPPQPHTRGNWVDETQYNGTPGRY